MEGVPRGIYTQEFGAHAVRQHEVERLTTPEGKAPETGDRYGNGIGSG